MANIPRLVATAAALPPTGLPKYANTYYVRKDGNDTTGNGSSAQPWLTVYKAASTIPIGGDALVLIGDGVYGEASGGLNYMYFNRAFTGWVEFRAENGAAGDVTIQGNNHTDNTVRFDSAAKIRFRFIKILPERTKVNAPIWLRVNTNNIEFYNCSITQLVTASPSRQIVMAAPTGTENINNILFKNCVYAASGTGNNAELRFLRANTAASATLDTIILDGCTSDSPVRLLGVTNPTLRNCTISVTGAARFAAEIGGDADGYAPTTGVKVEGNTLTSGSSHCLLIGYQTTGGTVTGNKLTGGDIGLALKECTGITVESNVITGGTNTTFRLKAAISCVARYNEISNSTGGNCVSASAGDGGNKTTNCTFTNNQVTSSGASPVLAWVADSGDAGGCVVDYNTYTLLGTAAYGQVRADTDVRTIEELRAAWTGYGAGTNDSHSTDNFGWRAAPAGWDAAWQTAKSTYGITPQWITIMGDSIGAGAVSTDNLTNGLFCKLRQTLIDASVVLYGDFISPYMSADGWAAGGGWAGGTPPWVVNSTTGRSWYTWGLSRHLLYAGNAAAGLYTYTSPYACTKMDIVYFNYNGGTWRYSLDGGASVQVTTTSNKDFGRVQLTGLVNTTHTISFGEQSVDYALQVCGVTAYAYVQGIGYCNMAFGGAGAYGYGQNNNQPVDRITPYGTLAYMPGSPALAIIELGINDCQGAASIASYTAALTRFITAFRTGKANCSIVLIAPSNPGEGSEISTGRFTNYQNWSLYKNAMRDLAAANNCCYLDFDAKWGNLTVTAGYHRANQPHPIDGGHADIAAAIYALIK